MNGTAPDERAMLVELRRRGVDAYIWQDAPGASYPPHTHPVTEHRWMLTGALRVTFAGSDAVVLTPGERLRVPAGVVHWAQAGPVGARYICWSEEDAETRDATDSAGTPASSAP